jgi:hypothetical protein
MSTSPHDEEPNELRPRDLFLDWVADNQTAFSPSRHDLERLVNASACSSTRRNVHVRRSALLAAGLAVAAAVIAALVSALASSADVTPPLVVVNEPLVVDTPVPASDTNIIETLEPWAAAALESDVRLDWRGTELAALELIYWDARGESTPRPGQHVPPPAYDRRGPPPPRRAPSPLDLVLERGEEVGLDRGRLEALEDEVIAAEPNRMKTSCSPERQQSSSFRASIGTRRRLSRRSMPSLPPSMRCVCTTCVWSISCASCSPRTTSTC